MERGHYPQIACVLLKKRDFGSSRRQVRLYQRPGTSRCLSKMSGPAASSLASPLTMEHAPILDGPG